MEKTSSRVRKAIGHIVGIIMVILFFVFMNDCNHYRQWKSKPQSWSSDWGKFYNK